jgi:hypothetical protein
MRQRGLADELLASGRLATDVTPIPAHRKRFARRRAG